MTLDAMTSDFAAQLPLFTPQRFTPPLATACTCGLCSGNQDPATGATGRAALGGLIAPPSAIIANDYTALLSPYSITTIAGKGAFQSFSFPTEVPTYVVDQFGATAAASFVAFNAAQQALARQAIALLGAASGLTFFEVAPGEGDIKFMVFDVQQLGQSANTAAFAYYPIAQSGNFTIPAIGSDTFFDPGRVNLSNLLHELGHAVGLKHPFDGNVVLAANQDNTDFTVMSYTSGGIPVNNYRTLDVQALRYLYGDNSKDGSFITSWSWDQSTLTLTQTGNNDGEDIRGIGGADIINAAGGDDLVFAGEGDDIVDGGSGADDVFGAEGNDRLVGGAGEDTLYGGDGNDVLVAADGRDFLFGDDGDDIFLITAAVVWQVSGGTGFDTVSFDGQAAGITYTINAARRAAGTSESHSGIEAAVGSGFADTITGTTQANRITGLGGDDRLAGGGGDDRFLYPARGFGADTITDFNAGDRIDLAALGVADLSMLAPFLVQSGADAVLTLGYAGTAESITFANTQVAALSAAGFVFNTGAAPRTVTGTSGRDVLFGGPANDLLDGGAGNDALVGGTGSDTYRVDRQDDVIHENANAGDDLAIAGAGYYLWANVERLQLAAGAGDIFGVGNDLANTLTGNEARNLLIGGSGDDTISGNGGDDALFGEAGNDSLNGEAGLDYLVGGTGNDTIDGGAGPDALYGEDGNDTLTGGSSFDTDILVGGTGNDTLFAASGQGDYDLIDGGPDNDTYYVDTPADLTFEAANGGTDTIVANITGAGYYLYANTENLILEGNTPFGVGNELANTLTGNSVSNYLLGGQGNDTLNGKQGNDVLFGESGADLFIFERGTGGDVIGDFQPGTDRIQLLGLGFTTYAQLSANFVEVAGTTAINLGQGDLIVLGGITNAALSTTDFIFG